MKKEYAICRTEKIKAWSHLGKSVGHNMRTSNDERSHLAKNHVEPIRVLAGDGGWVKHWKNDVKGMWLPDLKQGDRHTLAREFFLGASPEYFKDKTKEEIAEWAEDNVRWLRERFGEERLKLAVLHLDEQTPHIAAYVVPLKKDLNRKGEINARGNGFTLSDNGALKLGGSKHDLAKLQDEYAEAMKKFNLERGERHSKATHKSIRQWQTEMASALPDKIKYSKTDEPTLKDRFFVKNYGNKVAQKARAEIYRQMKPAYIQAKKVKDLEFQIKKQSEDIKEKEIKTNTLKEILERVLGQKISLSSKDGLSSLMKALKSFFKSKKKPEDDLPEIAFQSKPAPVLSAQAEPPEDVERPRVKHGSP